MIETNSKKLGWPYLLLLAAVAAALGLIAQGPRLALGQLAKAVENNDKAALAALVDTHQIDANAKRLLELQLRMQWQADKDKQPLMAAKDYWTAKLQIVDQVEKLTSPSGFPAYLRGELGNADSADLAAASRWIGEAKLHWQSPSTVHAELANAETGWNTRLVLARDGLFHWRIQSVVLPVDGILGRFAGELKQPAAQSGAAAAPASVNKL